MMEIQRLGMWKSDVLDQNIDQSFEGNSPLHIIVKRTILYIAQIMLRCKSHQSFHYRLCFPILTTRTKVVRKDLISEESSLSLFLGWEALKTTAEQHGSSIRSWQHDEDGRHLTEFGSRQSSMSPNAEEDDVLGNLSDNVQRLKDMLNGLIVVDHKNLGKRPRRQDSMDGVDQWKRTRFDSSKLHLSAHFCGMNLTLQYIKFIHSALQTNISLRYFQPVRSSYG